MPSSAACVRSRPVAPPSAGIDRSKSNDREGLVALRPPDPGPTHQSPHYSIPLYNTSSSSAAATYMKQYDPMTGIVMHPYAVAPPHNSTSPSERIAERHLVDIEQLFMQPQGSSPHTSIATPTTTPATPGTATRRPCTPSSTSTRSGARRGTSVQLGSSETPSRASCAPRTCRSSTTTAARTLPPARPHRAYSFT